MPTAIHCPTCNARLVLKDESLLGKRITCPKCQNQFRAKVAGQASPGSAGVPSRAQPGVATVTTPQVTSRSGEAKGSATLPSVAKPNATAANSSTNWDALVLDDNSGAATHDNVDFSDLGSYHAPVPVTQVLPQSASATQPATAGSPWAAQTREVAVVKQLSREERLAKEKERDKKLAVVGALAACGVLVVLVLLGAWIISGSMTKNQEMALAQETGELEFSPELADGFDVVLEPYLEWGTPEEITRNSIALFPGINETTQNQAKLLRANKPLRDIARVEGFQNSAAREWLKNIPKFGEVDPDSHAQREARARYMAACLRSALLTGPRTAPSPEKWKHFQLAEEAMFGDAALTKQKLKADASGTLVQLVERLESWAPTLKFEMPSRRKSGGSSSAGASGDDFAPEEGKANLATVFGFNAKKRALMTDYLKDQGNNNAKARLTVAMVVNALKKVADERRIDQSESFPEELRGLREKIQNREISRNHLQGPKIPIIFSKLIADYQNHQLKPEEEELAMFVIVAFLGNEIDLP